MVKSLKDEKAMQTWLYENHNLVLSIFRKHIRNFLKIEKAT